MNLKKFTILLSLAVAVIALSRVHSTSVSQEKIDNIPKQPQQTELDVWIDGLVELESNGRADIKVLDTNDRYSYSCLQFQELTFKSYVKRYNMLPHAEEAEIMNFIYDCDFQKRLAKRMIEENRQNYRHWYTSVVKRGLGLPPSS